MGGIGRTIWHADELVAATLQLARFAIDSARPALACPSSDGVSAEYFIRAGVDHHHRHAQAFVVAQNVISVIVSVSGHGGLPVLDTSSTAGCGTPHSMLRQIHRGYRPVQL